MGSVWLVFSEVCVGFKFPGLKLNFRKWRVCMWFYRFHLILSLMRVVSVALG